MASSFGAVLEPAREVGGDLYGVCAAGPERLVVFLGDVSGKGIPASMFMVRAISLARLLAREIAEPERILARLNDELAADNPSGMFVTFLCAVFEPGSGRLTLANAGHCRPVLLPAGEAPRWAVKNLGTALGFEPGLEFERTELTLHDGDALIFYTDGVSEAFNPQEECYGNERLLADAGAFAGQSAPAITAGFAPESPRLCRQRAAVRRHRHPGAESRRRCFGKGGPRMTLELHATPEEVMRAVEALQEFAQAQRRAGENHLRSRAGAGRVRQQHRQPRLAARPAEEIPSRHRAHRRHIRHRTARPRSRSSIRPPRPERKPQADDDDLPGGWGIQLVRRHMDEIRYRREAGENILRLTKRLVPAAGAE